MASVRIPEMPGMPAAFLLEAEITEQSDPSSRDSRFIYLALETPVKMDLHRA